MGTSVGWVNGIHKVLAPMDGAFSSAGVSPSELVMKMENGYIYIYMYKTKKIMMITFLRYVLSRPFHKPHVHTKEPKSYSLRPRPEQIHPIYTISQF